MHASNILSLSNFRHTTAHLLRPLCICACFPQIKALVGYTSATADSTNVFSLPHSSLYFCQKECAPQLTVNISQHIDRPNRKKINIDQVQLEFPAISQGKYLKMHLWFYENRKELGHSNCFGVVVGPHFAWQTKSSAVLQRISSCIGQSLNYLCAEACVSFEAQLFLQQPC